MLLSHLPTMFPKFAIRLLCAEKEELSLPDVSAFLYDFNLVYEISRIVADPKYEGFQFGRFVWHRNGRGIVSDDRLRVGLLSHHSPFELIALVAAVPAAVAAAWGIVQTAERLSNWRLNRQKLALEVRKLELETRSLEAERAPTQPQPLVVDVESFQVRSNEMGATPVLDTLTRRIEQSPVKIGLLEFKIHGSPNEQAKKP